METTFKPRKNLSKEIKQHMLSGYGIKIDGGATDKILVIPRDQFGHMEVLHKQMANLGSRTAVPGAFFLPRVNLKEIISELEGEGYTVNKKYCYSGCCQYNTNMYYLEGE